LNKYGNEATFGFIEECIPLDGAEQLTILHRVVENAPRCFDEFGKRYPLAMFPRDNNGKKLYQTDLASGIRTFNQYSIFVLHMSDEEVQEIDPGTVLYPFMVAASGEANDLFAVNYLMRRNPGLVGL
jgi:hypothetical protein